MSSQRQGLCSSSHFRLGCLHLQEGPNWADTSYLRLPHQPTGGEVSPAETVKTVQMAAKHLEATPRVTLHLKKKN
jgi:hypothetical protein